jgi:hypothetical protein
MQFYFLVISAELCFALQHVFSQQAHYFSLRWFHDHVTHPCGFIFLAWHWLPSPSGVHVAMVDLN